MKCLSVGILFFACNYIIWSRDLVFANTLVRCNDNNTKINSSKSNDCPIGMSHYLSDDNENETICDCKPRHIYFPLNNSCYEAYRQGPCPLYHYVVFSANTRGPAGPRCIPNLCLEDGTVIYNSTCHPLRTIGGPCAPDGVLDVNEITFELECVPIKVTPSIIIQVQRRKCPEGFRKDLSDGTCKSVDLNQIHGPQ